jgi:hypothetical protein
MLVGALMLSSCGCIKETKEEPKEAFGGKEMEIPSGWKVYENKEWGIRVAYPPKVEVVKSKSPGGKLDVDFKFENKELGDAFGISCEKIGKDFDLASYAAQSAYANKEDLEDVTVGGKPGKMEKHKVYVMPGEPADLCVWAYAVHKGRVFEFLFGGEDPWEEIGYKMLDTVEFF